MTAKKDKSLRAKKEQPDKSKKTKKNNPKTQIKKTKSPSETVAKFTKVDEYFDYLESIKEDTPDIKEWLKKKKKFLLVYGGKEEDRGKILDCFWEETKKFIPEQIPLIVKNKVNCFEKDDDELEKMIFFSNPRQGLDKFVKNSKLLDSYDKEEHNDTDISYIVKYLKYNYGTKIKNFLKKYKSAERKYHDLKKEYKFYTRKLDSEPKLFFGICKEAFSHLEEYDGKSKGYFFVDLVDAYDSFSKYNFLILLNISYRNKPVWIKLTAELKRGKLENRPDFIIVAAEKKSDIEGLHKPFKDMFDEIDLSEEDTLFMDDKDNALYFDENNIVSLTRKEIKLIKFMRGQKAYKLEQILTSFFGKVLMETYKHKQKNILDIYSGNATRPPIEEKIKAIPKEVRAIFDTYKSKINEKCKPLDIGDLIIKYGKVKKAYTLSRKIKIKHLPKS